MHDELEKSSDRRVNNKQFVHRDYALETGLVRSINKNYTDIHINDIIFFNTARPRPRDGQTYLDFPGRVRRHPRRWDNRDKVPNSGTEGELLVHCPVGLDIIGCDLCRRPQIQTSRIHTLLARCVDGESISAFVGILLDERVSYFIVSDRCLLVASIIGRHPVQDEVTKLHEVETK